MARTPVLLMLLLPLLACGDKDSGDDGTSTGSDDGGDEGGGEEGDGGEDGGDEGGGDEGGGDEGGGDEGGEDDTGVEPTDEVCDDGVDNDLDGHTDTLDMDCLTAGQLRTVQVYEGDSGVFDNSLGPSGGPLWLGLTHSGSLSLDDAELDGSGASTSVHPLDVDGAADGGHAVGTGSQKVNLGNPSSDGADGVVWTYTGEGRAGFDGATLGPEAHGLLHVDADGTASWLPITAYADGMAASEVVDGEACFAVASEYPIEVAGETWMEEGVGWVIGRAGLDGSVAVDATIEVSSRVGYFHTARLDDGACVFSGVIRGTVDLGGHVVEGGDLGRTIVARIEPEGDWSWVVEGSWSGGSTLLHRTQNGVVFGAGELSVDVTGEDWEEELGGSFWMELDADGAHSRTVRVNSDRIWDPTVFLELDDGTWVLSSTMKSYGSSPAVLRIDDTEGIDLPTGGAVFTGLMSISPEGDLDWFGQLAQDGGSGLTPAAAAVEGDQLTLTLQAYGSAPVSMDPDGPNARTVSTSGSSVLVTTWHR